MARAKENTGQVIFDLTREVKTDKLSDGKISEKEVIYLDCTIATPVHEQKHRVEISERDAAQDAAGVLLKDTEGKGWTRVGASPVQLEWVGKNGVRDGKRTGQTPTYGKVDTADNRAMWETKMVKQDGKAESKAITSALLSVFRSVGNNALDILYFALTQDGEESTARGANIAAIGSAKVDVMRGMATSLAARLTDRGKKPDAIAEAIADAIWEQVPDMALTDGETIPAFIDRACAAYQTKLAADHAAKMTEKKAADDARAAANLALANGENGAAVPTPTK